MGIVQLLTYICLIFLFVIAVCAIIGISQYLFWFYFKTCKDCGHHMFYRGFRHDSDGDFYYFHCRHCGRWKKISQADYLREIGKNVNLDGDE